MLQEVENHERRRENEEAKQCLQEESRNILEKGRHSA